MPMPKPHIVSSAILVAHALATLPDSVQQRRQLLVASLGVLPLDHPKRADVKLLIELLDQFDRAQLQLALNLGKGGVA